ncbi:ribosomal protein S5 domain 2-like protein [Artomyces pyxidatus]|uniref:Ribosomal protein S5 domain 2-like protein n=1 Tax=Artomyces pyxidatus TaxID=48021 RepID=A0ACB8TGH3_9AGAM|nr:ribosomal protein S5 domain 2-like protein [Artomyces pyxidatus]
MAFKTLSKSEKAYIQSSLQASSSFRSDGRALQDYRTVALETGVVPLANGSARINIGKGSDEGGGTEILAAAKLEVEDVEHGDGVEGGRVSCSVSCSPSAYPFASSGTLDDLQHDYTSLVHSALSHPSLRPANLSILRGKKSWLLSLDLVVLSDCGNVYDALFMAARAAMWDTKVPRTRSVEYRASKNRTGGGTGDMEVDDEQQSGLDTRQVKAATDFELEDYWDEGEPLAGRETWPVCITLNLLPRLHFLDATSSEEAAIPHRLLLAYSFASRSTPTLQGMQLLGPGEVDLVHIKALIQEGEKYASDLYTSLNTKLKDEDIRRTDKARLRFAAVR